MTLRYNQSVLERRVSELFSQPQLFACFLTVAQLGEQLRPNVVSLLRNCNMRALPLGSVADFTIVTNHLIRFLCEILPQSEVLTIS